MVVLDLDRSNCSDAKELTPVPALTSFKCIDVAAGSTQSFAVTESGKFLLRLLDQH